MLLVTGGAGFIGSAFVLSTIAGTGEPVLTLDALTYAGHRASLAPLQGDARHVFVHGDILDRALVARLLDTHRPRAIVHFAAESHVDRSLHGPDAFVQTNVLGTHALLECARAHLARRPAGEREAFRFLHVSTDEVYGALGPHDPPFTEATPYAPNSPYAASKAASDHLVRAAHHSHGLATLTTHCSNNYGPRQFPEKLIPLVIVNALAGRPLPVYGDGGQVRDWLHVDDHCRALRLVLGQGAPGGTWSIGARAEADNLSLVRRLCRLLDRLRPDAAGPHERLIAFVADRPGHDRRYAIDPSKIERELGWRPHETPDSGLEATVRWYLDNEAWLRETTGGAWREWTRIRYGAAADAPDAQDAQDAR